jgi:2-oxo-4-hydroxy-4-carboxy--5-ureidoimidazoline (OHCU) decarboxylase
MIVVMLITAVETTGDVFATGEIVEKAINQEDIARALRADGLSTLLGGILNSFPYTCFAENIGLVRLTRVKSRFVVAYHKRPFNSMYDLRRALQDALFEAPQERQLGLIRSYPDLGRFMRPEDVSTLSASDGTASPCEIPSYAVEGLARAESLRDQSAAGLDRLTPEESETFSSLNRAYRDKFGFPLVFCVRENTKETILASGKERLENSPAQEKAAGLLEIIKIANLRLQDIIETPISAVTTR